MDGLLNINNPHLYIAIGLSIINGILLCIVGYKFLQIIQLTGYKLRGFYLWTKQTKGNYIVRITLLSFISFMCMLTINIILGSLIPKEGFAAFFGYISLVFYFYFAIFFSLKIKGAQPARKTPLRYTRRMTRLLGCLMLFATLFTFGVFCLAYIKEWALASSLLGATPVALLILVPLAFYVMLPFELLNNQRYIAMTRRKLKRIEREKKLYKIGITGSYAKTTTKNILHTLLSEKYEVCVSPASFNTPMGLTKTVLKFLHKEHDVLIVEMGARRRGDIKKLCGIVKPDIAILTSVGNQHLETFKNIETIKSTKFELIESLQTSGFAVFNGESEPTHELFKKTTVKKVQTGFNSKYFTYAKDIKVSENGTEFILCINGDEYKTQTRLLGIHNIENILMAAAAASHLHMSGSEIAEGIKKLAATSHRLELIKSENGVTILDDSFNSNIKGAKQALSVLSLFGGDKFVATPGIVEVGREQFATNKEFAAEIAKVAAGVFVINEINKKALIAGLKEAGFAEDKIYQCKNLKEAQEQFKTVLKSGDTLLIENDLPDNFN